MARVHAAIPVLWQRALILQSGTVIGLVVVLGLQWGRPVLVPIAMAALLTILLNPVVKALQSRGLGRVLSVGGTVLAVGVVLMCLGWVLTRQVSSLLSELPQSTGRIIARVKTLRQLGSGPFAERFEQMIDEITREIQHPSQVISSTRQDQSFQPNDLNVSPSEVVQYRSELTGWRSYSEYLGTAFESLMTLAFALVLLVFFLLASEDLRDRAVLLAGKARLVVTSKALKDVTDRISRYIVTVAVVNGGFALLLALGMIVLGMPYALLWGVLAGGLRFVPYIGPWIGALFPITMSLAASEGWWQPLAVFGYVMALELITNNIIEPLIYRHSTGVSPTALLVSAAFWLYLWGPIGLVLSAPFAVCLVALGTNIPQFGFLNLLLGDVPALRPNEGLYQRFMLRDKHEAARIVIQRMKDFPVDDVYDEMLVPALNYTNRDVQRGDLTESDQQAVLEGMRETLRQCKLYHQSTSIPVPPEDTPDDINVITPSVINRARILGCPATDDTDCLGLEMLGQLLNPFHWKMEIAAVDTLTSELVARITKDPPAAICIASLPPGGLSHARYLCKRLRDSVPGVPIIVGRWRRNRSCKLDRERLEQAGAGFVTTTLLETCQVLESRFLLLKRETLAASASTVLDGA